MRQHADLSDLQTAERRGEAALDFLLAIAIGLAFAVGLVVTLS